MEFEYKAEAIKLFKYFQSYFRFQRDIIKIKSNDFVRAFAIVAGMAFIMISVAYGITYIFEDSSIKLPIASHYIFFIFSIGFVLFSIFFEKEIGAVYPKELIGGAIASACLTFIITAAIGGMQYIWENGLSYLGIDTVLYAFSVSMILSLILYFVGKRINIKVERNEFVRVLSIVILIAFIIMISIVYGINYILKINVFPIPPYLILFIFSIGLVIASVYIEKKRKDAVYPWLLVGGAITSACLTFIITSAIGGIRYILEKGFTSLGIDTVLYTVSICTILSMILFNLYNNFVKDKL